MSKAKIQEDPQVMVADDPEVGTTGQVIDPRGIDHPKHYNSHPSGLEVIVLLDDMTANIGNVTKYILRHVLKDGFKDAKKAVWYAERAVSNHELDTFMPWSVRGRRLQHNLQRFIDTESDRRVQRILLQIWDAYYHHGRLEPVLGACTELVKQLTPAD
jgi:hypothetical protein